MGKARHVVDVSIVEQGGRAGRLLHEVLVGPQNENWLTESGQALEAACSDPQQERVARAFRLAGPEAVEGYRRVLSELIDAESRDAILAQIRK